METVEIQGVPKVFLTPYLLCFLSLSQPWAKPDISHRLRPMGQSAPGPRRSFASPRTITRTTLGSQAQNLLWSKTASCWKMHTDRNELRAYYYFGWGWYELGRGCKKIQWAQNHGQSFMKAAFGWWIFTRQEQAGRSLVIPNVAGIVCLNATGKQGHDVRKLSTNLSRKRCYVSISSITPVSEHPKNMYLCKMPQ